MRYSLTSLLVIVFLIALVMALWIRREPWELASLESVKNFTPDASRGVSPDGTRRFGTLTYDPSQPHEEQRLEILDATTQRSLYRLPMKIHVRRVPEFHDNDTITVYREEVTQSPQVRWEKRTYRRRFPEWWWGHFYRPEVWLSLFLIGVILTRIARNQLQAEKESGVKDSV